MATSSAASLGPPGPSFLAKWARYVRAEVNEYSATTEWADAQAQHLELMTKLPPPRGAILDLGCGDGWSTHRLQQLGWRATGVTISPREAEHARARYGLTLLVADMHDLPLPDRSFAAIYCRESYEHTVAPYVVLCEMNRILEPGGRLLVNLPWEEWIREDSHFSVLTPPQMREMLYKCRFVVEEEGRTAAGHFWYRARKVAELSEKHPFPPPVPGRAWIEGQVAGAPAAPAAPPPAASPLAAGRARLEALRQAVAQALELQRRDGAPALRVGFAPVADGLGAVLAVAELLAAEAQRGGDAAARAEVERLRGSFLALLPRLLAAQQQEAPARLASLLELELGPQLDRWTALSAQVAEARP